MSIKESSVQNQSELTQIFLDHKLDLLFNRQLRIHRERLDFEACFTRTNEISLPGFIPIWRKIINLDENSHLAEVVLMLSIDNFFLQITENTLNRDWIISFFEKNREMVKLFK